MADNTKDSVCDDIDHPIKDLRYIEEKTGLMASQDWTIVSDHFYECKIGGLIITCMISCFHGEIDEYSLHRGDTLIMDGLLLDDACDCAIKIINNHRKIKSAHKQ